MRRGSLLFQREAARVHSTGFGRHGEDLFRSGCTWRSRSYGQTEIFFGEALLTLPKSFLVVYFILSKYVPRSAAGRRGVSVWI